MLDSFKTYFSKLFGSMLGVLLIFPSMLSAQVETTSFLNYVTSRNSDSETRLEQKINSTLSSFLNKDEYSVTVKFSLNTGLMRQDLPQDVQEQVVFDSNEANADQEPLLPLTRLGLYKKPEVRKVS